MSDCANCGHSHTYDGPSKPYKPVETPCWKCGCKHYADHGTEQQRETLL